MVGTISNLIVDKRFGFISGGNGQEYFFHESDTEDCWETLVTEFRAQGGGKVQTTFEPEKTPKGPRARNVTYFEP